MTEKAKRRLKNFNFEATGSHVALCSKDNPGANNYTTLICKQTSGITDTQVAEQIALIEKAKYSSQVKAAIESALREKYDDNEWWVYVEDYNDTEAIFWKDDSLYSVAYTVDQDENYILAETANEVKREYIYSPTGKVEISEDAEKKLEEGVYVLVAKALSTPETIGRAEQALATYNKKKEKMQEEIQKAVEAKDAEIAKLQADMASLQEIVKAAEAEKKANTLKSREGQVAALLKEGAVELVKSTETLNDEAFAQIVKALSVQKAAIEESGLMNEISNPNAGALQEINKTQEIIKARYAK
jgi:hypothetical protein